jgi:hypothetical protein
VGVYVVDNTGTPVVDFVTPTGVWNYGGDWTKFQITWDAEAGYIDLLINGISHGPKSVTPFGSLQSTNVGHFVIGNYCKDWQGGVGGLRAGNATFDDLRITNTVAYPAVTVDGTIIAAGYLGDTTTVGIQFDFQPTAGGEAMARSVFLDAHGHFTLIGVASGTYDITVRGDTWLATELHGVAVGPGPTTLGPIELTGADSNGDNAVSFDDFMILQNSYGRSGAGVAAFSAAAADGCGVFGIVVLLGLGLAFCNSDVQSVGDDPVCVDRTEGVVFRKE